MRRFFAFLPAHRGVEANRRLAGWEVFTLSPALPREGEGERQRHRTGADMRFSKNTALEGRGLERRENTSLHI